MNFRNISAWSIRNPIVPLVMFIGFVIAGHVFALTLAHDRALVLYEDAKAAVRSQYWLLGVMVVFTTLALWLLAQAREG